MKKILCIDFREKVAQSLVEKTYLCNKYIIMTYDS